MTMTPDSAQQATAQTAAAHAETTRRISARVRYLLAGSAIVTLLYPLSEVGYGLDLLYLVMFCGFFGLGVTYIAAEKKWVPLALAGAVWQTGLGVYFLVVASTQAPPLWLTLALFGGFVVFDGVLVIALLRFVFVEVHRLSSAVLYAAISAYILLGYMFAPLYLCLETLTQATTGASAFLVGYAPEAVLTWQKFVYYSFVTLATLGYGDILPITSTAQALAAAEAVIGVLYVAILVGRLVGLNANSGPTG